MKRPTARSRDAYDRCRRVVGPADEAEMRTAAVICRGAGTCSSGGGVGAGNGVPAVCWLLSLCTAPPQTPQKRA
jgi:hypothetical protein